MEDYLFQEDLESYRSVTEATAFLELYNYEGAEPLYVDQSTLATDEDFHNFVRGTGVFALEERHRNLRLTSGLRLVLQQNATKPQTFASDVIPFEKDDFVAILASMRLPKRVLETVSAVGPFLWFTFDDSIEGKPVFQLVFRKSDVKWTAGSRGWEMVLSYDYCTRTTSGYIKGTKSAEIDRIIRQLKACAAPSAHPLLLPFLVLRSELSPKTDRHQRDLRDKLRNLEHALSQRYKDKGSASESPAAADANLLELDSINRDLTDCHCQVLWKRPQTWQNAVTRLTQAAAAFWGRLPTEDRGLFEELHRTLLDRLEFLKIKLEGMENYTHITLERLNLQRDVMHSILDQRESRLSLEIAVQQQRLGYSMKTLALLGAFFLLGTFLSSVFGMSFFDFSPGENKPVSRLIWIFFAVMLPVTGLIVGAWFLFDRMARKSLEVASAEDEKRMLQLEKRVTERVVQRAKARVSVGVMGDMEAQNQGPEAPRRGTR